MRKFAPVLAGLLLLGGTGFIVLPQPAAADDVLHHVYRTGGEGLVIHGDAGLGSVALGVLPEDADFAVQCWTASDTVNSNPVWLRGTSGDLSGYVADYYIDTHWSTTEDLTNQGIPECSSQSSTPDWSNPAPAPSNTSVFFSGTDIANGSADGPVADTNVALKDWSGGDHCQPTRAIAHTPSGTTTLSGWSRGRVGVIYDLAWAPADQIGSVDTIILFDPGTDDEMNAACDQRYATNDLIKNWLDERETNRLIIFSGERTEDKWFGHYGPATFGGIRNHYLRDVRSNPALADQVLICDYNDMAHAAVLRTFADSVSNPPNSCPDATNGPEAVTVTP